MCHLMNGDVAREHMRIFYVVSANENYAMTNILQPKHHKLP